MDEGERSSLLQKSRPELLAHGRLREGLLAYLPAFSALRLAALGSTTALNFAPGTNLGTVEAGILSAAPVAGFLPVRAARLADLKVPKPTSCTALAAVLDGPYPSATIEPGGVSCNANRSPTPGSVTM